MPSVVAKLEFYNMSKTPVEKMGQIDYPANDFTLCFVDPPVGDDYYTDMKAIATFDNGTYTDASPGTVKCYFNVTAQPLFDTAGVVYISGTSLANPSTMDMSYVTEFTIDSGAIAKFVLEHKKTSETSWTSVDITPSKLANVYTGVFSLDTTDEAIYMLRIKAVDSVGDESDWSPIKYANKNTYVAWDNSGTDAVTWDNAGSDLVLY